MESIVKRTYDSYPAPIRSALLMVRKAIFEVGIEEQIEPITETLKWQQPSYLAKHGSTIRLGWGATNPDEYSVYFNCKSVLVETFRELYRDEFRYQSNRAIVFTLGDNIPMTELKHCLSMALRYHQIKKLPLLGAM